MNISYFVQLIFISVVTSLISLISIQKLSEDAPLSAGFKFCISALCILNVYSAFSFSQMPYFYTLFGIYLIITGGIDHLTKTIVVSLTLLGGFTGIIMHLIFTTNVMDALYGGLIGFTLYYAIYYIAKWIYKKEAFGFGDVLFMASIGLFLGFKSTMLASFLTFYVALLGVVLIKLVGKVVKLKSEIAFAPFISISAAIVLYFGDSILKFYLDFVGL